MEIAENLRRRQGGCRSAGRHDARDGWLRGLPHPPEGIRGPHHDADRQGRGDRPGGWTGAGRGRLRD